MDNIQENVQVLVKKSNYFSVIYKGFRFFNTFF